MKIQITLEIHQNPNIVMSSWLNLSNIADNVASFTKDVLTDASRAGNIQRDL